MTSVATEDNAQEDPQALQAQRELYADEAEAAVKNVKQTIKHLQDSLKDREADAKRLRAEAKENKR